MTTDEMIAVLVAAKNGKFIQTRLLGSKKDWRDCPYPEWNFCASEYRVKLKKYYVVIGVFPPSELVIGGTFGTAVCLTKEAADSEKNAMEENGLTDISIHEIEK